MNGFVIYIEDIKAMQGMSDEQVGKVFRLLADYAASGDLQKTGDLTCDVVANMLLPKIDRDKQSYDARIKNGRLGGRPKKNPEESESVPENQEVSNDDGNNQQVSDKNLKNRMVSDEKLKNQKEKEKENENEYEYGDEDQKENTKEKAANPLDERFDRFWRSYPKKVSKETARKVWHRIKPSEELAQTMIDAITAQKASPQWTRDHGQYIPNPATWLNGGRWEDEVTEVAAYNPWLNGIRAGGGQG